MQRQEQEELENQDDTEQERLFKELTDTDLRAKLAYEKDKIIEENMLPLGFLDAGMGEEDTIIINNINPEDDKDIIY